jgi:NADP-dependent 3-hydroxy acid dehydrogenase YdfG
MNQTTSGVETALRAVVTGASSGIGMAISTAIASTGATMCMVGRDIKRLELAAHTARYYARSVFVHEADLTDESAIDRLARRVEEDMQGLDVLVHCAGAHAKGAIDATPVEQLDNLYRTNVRMPFLLTKALLPFLKTRQGQIVFINSSQGRNARAYTGLFAATQHALKALADSLRDEVNGDGVRVLSVYPGRTATPRMQSLYELENQKYQSDLLLQPEDIAKVVLNSLLLAKTAEVTNIEIRPRIKSY